MGNKEWCIVFVVMICTGIRLGIDFIMFLKDFKFIHCS